MAQFEELEELSKETEEYQMLIEVAKELEKQERIEKKPGKIEEFSNKLSNADMVMESSSTWYWLYEILYRRHWVVLSNLCRSNRLRLCWLKTDKVDALMLANLLRGGYIAESYVPSRRIMGLRELVRAPVVFSSLYRRTFAKSVITKSNRA